MLKAGDWVVRIANTRAWERGCIEAGINPFAPIKVSEVIDGEPIFYQINGGTWFAEYFKRVVDIEGKSLGDYL